MRRGDPKATPSSYRIAVGHSIEMCGFQYTASQLASLTTSISPERLNPHLVACQGDVKAAIRRYESNVAVSEALYGVLQALEVTLRNAMHRQLSDYAGTGDWFGRFDLLPAEEQTIQKARAALARSRKPETPGRMVAELPFGFWTALTSRFYSEKIWIPCLHKAFPRKRLGHRTASQRLNEIRVLRNRVAHHEPILHLDLLGLHGKVLETIGWMCADTECWVRDTTRLAAVLMLPGNSLDFGEDQAD